MVCPGFFLKKLLDFTYVRSKDNEKIISISSIDDGGVKLDNGCYSMIILVKQQDGSILIRTVQDCRGGRPI